MSSNSDPTLLKRWTDVLQYWEKKRSRYEIDKANTTDPTKQLECQQGIDTCQDVIDTCQGLIQALNAQEGAPAPASVAPLGMLAPESAETGSVESETDLVRAVAASAPAPTQGLEAEMKAPKSEAGATSTLPMSTPVESSPQTQKPSPQTQPSQRQDVGHQRAASVPVGSATVWLKRILGGALPILMVVAVFLALFRSRDNCKIAPDGSYSPDGLSLQVRKVLAADPRYASLKSISVAQYGCTIVLRGMVPTRQLADELVQLVRQTQVPSQTLTERVKRRFNWGQSEPIQPIEAVQSELRVAPTVPRRP